MPASDSAAAAAAPEESKPAAPPVGKTPSAKDYFDNRYGSNDYCSQFIAVCNVCQIRRWSFLSTLPVSSGWLQVYGNPG